MEGMTHAHKACQNKRCIPIEGMPHALRACQKKGENEEKIAHVLKEKEKENEKERDGS